MALRDAGGQGGGPPGLDAVHSHTLQVRGDHEALEQVLMMTCFGRTKPRLQLETDPYTKANFKTQLNVNQHLTVRYRDPISKDFTLHLEDSREVKRVM